MNYWLEEDLKERLQTHLTQLVRDRDPYLATAGHFLYSNTSVNSWNSGEM